jgi:TPP-dependent pyruvate/acetoin dehydrogenase alpha subunit
VSEWRQRDPVVLLQQALCDHGALDDEQIAAIEAEIAATIDAAVAFGDAGTLEPVDDLTRHVTADGGGR